MYTDVMHMRYSNAMCEIRRFLMRKEWLFFTSWPVVEIVNPVKIITIRKWKFMPRDEKYAANFISVAEWRRNIILVFLC